MKKNIEKQRMVTIVLFGIYMFVITWIILFKMQFSISALSTIRSINLIPFHESVIINNQLYLKEILLNIAIFIPLGVYSCVVFERWSLWKIILLSAGISFLYETLQYLLAIGASDITDLIGNTLGGCLGILIFFILQKMCKNKRTAIKIVNCVAMIGTFFVIGFLVILILANW